MNAAHPCPPSVAQGIRGPHSAPYNSPGRPGSVTGQVQMGEFQMKNVRWVGFMTWAASMIVPFAAPAAESELWWGQWRGPAGSGWPSEGARPLSGVRARTSAGSVSCRARGLRRRQSGAISCTFRPAIPASGVASEGVRGSGGSSDRRASKGAEYASQQPVRQSPRRAKADHPVQVHDHGVRANNGKAGVGSRPVRDDSPRR